MNVMDAFVGIFMSLVIIGILVGTGLLILTQFQTSINATLYPEASAAIGTVITLFSTALGFLAVAVIAVIGFAILQSFGMIGGAGARGKGR